MKEKSSQGDNIYSILKILAWGVVAAALIYFFGLRKFNVGNVGIEVENTETSSTSREESPKENESPRENNQREPEIINTEPESLDSKYAVIKVRNYHLMKSDMFLIDEVSGTKRKIESSNIKLPIPISQSTVQLKIEDANGKSFGTATSDCCKNNLNITYHE